MMRLHCIETIVLGLIGGLCLLTGCGKPVSSAASSQTATLPRITSTTEKSAKKLSLDPSPSPIRTLPAPIINIINPTPTDTPRPPTLTPTRTPIPPTVTRMSGTTEPAATPSPALTPTLPPPSLPSISKNENEHYWFYRPVPSGDGEWTDKTYPYGSTRGGTLRPHRGVEFAVPSGTEVSASAAGTVVVAGNDSAERYGPSRDFYGNLVVIEHDRWHNGKRAYTLYAHLSEVYVAKGMQVDPRQPIGLSGSSGIADGPHLHFEVRVGGNEYEKTRNPSLWISPFPERGTVAGRVTFPNGTQLSERLITAHRLDGKARYHGTTTYAIGHVNSDDGWGETFVLDDMEPGYFKIQTKVDGKTYKAETWVYPHQTSFVEIVLRGE